MKEIHFFDEIYRTNFIFIVGKKEECEAKMQQYGHAGFVCGDGDGMTYFNPEWGAIIWLRDFKKSPKWLGDLTHEIIHTASGVFKSIQWRYDVNNEEPFTYYCGWLMRKILDGFGRA